MMKDDGDNEIVRENKRESEKENCLFVGWLVRSFGGLLMLYYSIYIYIYAGPYLGFVGP